MLGSSASEIRGRRRHNWPPVRKRESAAAVSETTTTVEEGPADDAGSQPKSQERWLTARKRRRRFRKADENRRRKSWPERGGFVSRWKRSPASMVRLSEQSQTIGQVVATVEDLAAQSNLLAVNAAIEAAKAGEHGKGFGVVAQEVKSLAEQSRQATNQVRAILERTFRESDGGMAVMATEQGSKAVETGARQTVAAGESIQALANSVDRGGAGRDADRRFQPAAIGRGRPGGRRDGKHQAGERAKCSERASSWRGPRKRP